MNQIEVRAMEIDPRMFAEYEQELREQREERRRNRTAA